MAEFNEEREREAFDRMHMRMTGPQGGFTSWSIFNAIEKAAAWKAWKARALSPSGWPLGLLDRIKAAEQRVQDNRAPRSIPADPHSDVDLVLAEIRYLIEDRWPPFWIKDATDSAVDGVALPAEPSPFGWLFEGPEGLRQFTKARDFAKPVLDLHRRMADEQPGKYKLTALYAAGVAPTAAQYAYVRTDQLQKALTAPFLCAVTSQPTPGYTRVTIDAAGVQEVPRG